MSLSALVVGAGPSGLQATRALLSLSDITVTIIDQCSKPYGLAAWGVAPDHTSSTKTMTELAPVLADPRVKFQGSTAFGVDISRESAVQEYDIVVYAFGCDEPRRLGVAGEDLAGVLTAPQLFHWYTAAPGAEQLRMSGATNIVVIGAGDTANDCARIFTQSSERLDALTLAPAVRGELRATQPRNITMLIRGGIEDVKFKPRDLPALINADGIQVRAENLHWPLCREVTPAVRNSAELIYLACQREVVNPRMTLTLHFHTQVHTIQGTDQVHGVVLDDAAATVLPADLVITALGFQRTRPLADLPMNSDGTISAELNRVSGSAKEYVVGWAARGANGGFGTCRREGDQLAEILQAKS